MPANRLWFLSLACAAIGFAQKNPAEFFEARIRPVLANNCYSCHTRSKLGGLKLDSRASLLQGGNSGPGIVPGQPADSLLIKAVIQTDAKLKMPMGGAKLSEKEIADLTYWVRIGAPWPDSKEVEKPLAAVAGKGFAITPQQREFWSFQPVRKPAPPPVKDAGWVQTPIDHFILAKLEEKGLKPLPPADKRVLIRRATYDLIGLPATPEEIEAFVNDASPGAFANVVDRLLASPHYGERWGRHWLDVARYADGEGGSDPDAVKGKAKGQKGMVFIGYGMARDGYANTWRYRDWVIDAINEDMPYDQFIKAQIAADLLPDKQQSKKLLPGLGFFGLGPWFTGDDEIYEEARANERDDMVDALSKGVLGLTVTCARCHDHKYDPISQRDYYAMAGIFGASGYWEYSLAPKDRVAQYQDQWKKVKAQQAAIGEFLETKAIGVAETLAAQTSGYMMAGRKILLSKPRPDPAAVAAQENLDPETLQRWVKYLGVKERPHPYLRDWDALIARGGGNDEDAARLAAQFQKMVFTVIGEKKSVEESNREMKKNYNPDPNEASVLLPGDLMQFELFRYKQQLVQKVVDTDHYYVWMDTVQSPIVARDFGKQTAIYEYKDDDLIRFFTPEEKVKLQSMQAELEPLQKTLPPEYPYVMALADNPKPSNLKLNLRGNPHNLGPEVTRGFPAVFGGNNDPVPFTTGSGRLQLADAIVKNPLTPRVMANRIWMEHFGKGIVATPTNFGMMGERPTHPELLDYLASRLMENHWSMKGLHREIMLSAAYQLRYGASATNAAADPDNQLLWRANLRRMDAEELRDSLLFVAGALDERLGGPGQSLNSAKNKKRTVYGKIARTAPDRMLTLFDFPDPTISGDQRSQTNVPTQGLFFMNSDMMWQNAGLVAQRLSKEEEADVDWTRQAYRLLFGREPSEAEIQRALKFLDAAAKDSGGRKAAWRQYAQALLSSGEFTYIN
jgi:hypothetical protein